MCTYIHIHTCIHADAHIHIYTPQMLSVWSMMSNSHRNILGLTLAEESTCFVGSTQEGLAGCLVSVSHVTGNCQTVLQPGSWLSSPLCFKLGNEIHQGPCCPPAHRPPWRVWTWAQWHSGSYAADAVPGQPDIWASFGNNGGAGVLQS